MKHPSSAVVLALLLGPVGASAQATPGTDIWIFRVSGEAEAVELGSRIQATSRPGYDNQPHFPPGERALLYTSIDSTGQADIWSYDFRSDARRNVTESRPESEYSAAVMPDLTRFSAIRVEADSTQRLWSFTSGGVNAEVVLEDIQPVGYHAWLDEDRLALFVLGTPATLQMASVSEGVAEVVAENIGRSLHRIPGRGTVSYVQLDSDGAARVVEFDPETGESATLAPVLEGNEFHAWTPGGTLIMGQGSKLFRWEPGQLGAWEEFADLESAGVSGISRIAVSPGGEWIAVVGEDSVETSPSAGGGLR